MSKRLSLLRRELWGQRKWVDVVGELLIGTMGQHCRSYVALYSATQEICHLHNDAVGGNLPIEDIRDEKVWPKPTQHLGTGVLRGFEAEICFNFARGHVDLKPFEVGEITQESSTCNMQGHLTVRRALKESKSKQLVQFSSGNLFRPLKTAIFMIKLVYLTC